MRLLVSGPLQGELQSNLSDLVGAQRIKSITDRTVQFEYDAPPSDHAKTLAKEWCSQARLDFYFDDRNLKLSETAILAMDMDSTLITTECIDQLAERVGKAAEISRITDATMRGNLDFNASIRARVSLLAGAPSKILDDVYNEIKLSNGAAELLSTAKQFGAKTALVSGGFTYFADRLQKRLDFDFTLANELEIVSDQLTGKLKGPIIGPQAKAEFISTTAMSVRASYEQIIVIGDGANDIPMMRLAGTSIGYRAKPIVKAAATCYLDNSELDVLLEWFN